MPQCSRHGAAGCWFDLAGRVLVMGERSRGHPREGGLGSARGDPAARVVVPVRARFVLLVLSTTRSGFGGGPWAVGSATDALAGSDSSQGIRDALRFTRFSDRIGALCLRLSAVLLRNDLAWWKDASQ